MPFVFWGVAQRAHEKSFDHLLSPHDPGLLHLLRVILKAIQRARDTPDPAMEVGALLVLVVAVICEG